MKSFDSRVYSVNDYREWEQSGQLILAPRFQRRTVWTEAARSYLMDTIIRGKPMPGARHRAGWRVLLRCAHAMCSSPSWMASPPSL